MLLQLDGPARDELRDAGEQSTRQVQGRRQLTQSSRLEDATAAQRGTCTTRQRSVARIQISGKADVDAGLGNAAQV